MFLLLTRQTHCGRISDSLRRSIQTEVEPGFRPQSLLSVPQWVMMKPEHLPTGYPGILQSGNRDG